MEIEISGDEKKTDLNLNQVINKLEIEKIVYKGLGLSHYKGNPVFVYHGVPGDLVKVKVVHKKKKVYFAEIIKYNQKSDLQIPQKCDVFGICGGCDWLNLDYTQQLEVKKQNVDDFFQTLQHQGVKDVVGSPLTEQYRNKAIMPLTSQQGIPVIGMYARRSHRVIKTGNCYIQPQIFNEISKIILDHFYKYKVEIYNEKTGTGNVRYLGYRITGLKKKADSKLCPILVIIVTRSRKIPFSKLLVNSLIIRFPNITGIIQNINKDFDNVILKEDEKVLYGRDYFIESIGSYIFNVHYSSFFQVNTTQTENLYRYVKSRVKTGYRVIDAYSGIGTIGIYISDKAEYVYCLEISSKSHNDAIHNAKTNNVENCEFINNNVEEGIGFIFTRDKIDLVIFDPPRKGLEQGSIDVIQKFLPAVVIYISCEPSTQKRDVEKLLEAGYKIEEIQPFDMFPQTYHIENVVVLNYSSTPKDDGN